MRLIDADRLMDAMYHRVFETGEDTMWQSGCWVRYRAINQVVQEQPTIDAVPVVRCDKCRHHYERGRDIVCAISDDVVMSDDYCSYWEGGSDNA